MEMKGFKECRIEWIGTNDKGEKRHGKWVRRLGISEGRNNMEDQKIWHQKMRS